MRSDKRYTMLMVPVLAAVCIRIEQWVLTKMKSDKRYSMMKVSVLAAVCIRMKQ